MYIPQKQLDNLKDLFAHLKHNRCLRPLNCMNNNYLSIFSHEVLSMIKNQDPKWYDCVPQQVAQLIKQRNLFQDN